MRSGKEINYSKEQVLKAIKDSYGITSQVAENLNCSWATARKYVNKWECTKKALDEENEKSLDFSESMLLKRIQEGSDQMIKFHLATKGKKRGYNDESKVEITADPDSKLLKTIERYLNNLDRDQIRKVLEDDEE